MKPQYIATALLAASGLAHAAPVDNGYDGVGDLFFNMWNGTHVYSTNLNVDQDSFTAAVAGDGDYSFMRDLSADSRFTAFIGSSNPAELQWNVLAVESQGQRTVHTTYDTVPGQTQMAPDGRSMVLGIQTYIGRVNDAMAPGTNAVVLDRNGLGWTSQPCTNGYATQQAFNNCGTLANNSLATALGFAVETFNGTGTSRGSFSALADNNLPVKVWIDGNHHLNMVAAVPEPQTYALLLVGLGLLGAVTRRR